MPKEVNGHDPGGIVWPNDFPGCEGLSGEFDLIVQQRESRRIILQNDLGA